MQNINQLIITKIKILLKHKAQYFSQKMHKPSQLNIKIIQTNKLQKRRCIKTKIIFTQNNTQIIKRILNLVIIKIQNLCAYPHDYQFFRQQFKIFLIMSKKYVINKQNKPNNYSSYQYFLHFSRFTIYLNPLFFSQKSVYITAIVLSLLYTNGHQIKIFEKRQILHNQYISIIIMNLQFINIILFMFIQYHQISLLINKKLVFYYDIHEKLFKENFSLKIEIIFNLYLLNRHSIKQYYQAYSQIDNNNKIIDKKKMKERKNSIFVVEKNQKHQRKFSQEFSVASTARYQYHQNIGQDLIQNYIITDQFRTMNSIERKTTFTKKNSVNWTSIFYPSQNFKSDGQKQSILHQKILTVSKSNIDHQFQSFKQNVIPQIKQNNHQESLKFIYYEEDSNSDKQSKLSKKNRQQLNIDKPDITIMNTLIQDQNINKEIDIYNQMQQDYKLLVEQKKKINQMRQKIYIQAKLLEKEKEQIQKKLNFLKRDRRKNQEKILQKSEIHIISQLDEKLRRIEELKAKSKNKKKLKHLILQKLMINLIKYKNQQNYEIRKIKKFFMSQIICISKCKKMVKKIYTQLVFINIKKIKEGFNKIKLFAKRFDCSSNYKKLFQNSKQGHKNKQKGLSIDSYRFGYQSYIKTSMQNNKNIDIQYSNRKTLQSPKSKKIISYQKKDKSSQNIQNNFTKTKKNFSQLIKVSNLMKKEKISNITLRKFF